MNSDCITLFKDVDLRHIKLFRVLRWWRCFLQISKCWSFSLHALILKFFKKLLIFLFSKHCHRFDFPLQLIQSIDLIRNQFGSYKSYYCLKCFGLIQIHFGTVSSHKNSMNTHAIRSPSMAEYTIIDGSLLLFVLWSCIISRDQVDSSLMAAHTSSIAACINLVASH